MGMSQNEKLPLAGNGHRLNAQETQVLQYLMGNRKRAVSTRQLTEHALGDLYDPASRRVDQIVFQLRKKLGSTVIADRPGYGYVYEGERGRRGNRGVGRESGAGH
jgi:DNA-binding response OmpR family regulator